MTQYDIGLLIGRAFALANGEQPASWEATIAELRTLAEDDPPTLQLARARCLRFVDRNPDDSREDRRALELLDAALDDSAVHDGSQRPPRRLATPRDVTSGGRTDAQADAR